MTLLRGAAAPPVNHGLWLSSFSPGEQARLLLPDIRRATDGVDPFEPLYRHERGVQDLRKPLWTLLVLELWRRERIAAPAGQGARSAC
jgi:hypothetical protein